ncbi:hypothetical protein K7G81_07825 [Hephaestia sp. CMS5P-6]|nr:hypothetical protein [Hephaestia mangrovi]
MALGLALALTSTVVLGAPRSSIDYNWRSVSVGGGGFAPDVVFSRAARGLAYLRTDMGGAYRWDGAVGRWTPLEDSIATGSYMGVESIAADPVDPDIVYLAVGMSSRSAAAILRSTDRGAHWQIVPVPFRMGGNEDGRGLGERLAIDPRRTNTLLFGSRHQGLWRSDDGARHWRKVASFPLPGLGVPNGRSTHGGLSFVLFAPHTPGRIFVASADPGPHHLFVSEDDGKHWRQVEGGPDPALLPVKAVIGGDGILTIAYCDGIGPNGITRGAVWRYDPASGRWTDVTPDKRPDAPPGGYMGVAVSARDPQLIAVSTVDRTNPVDTVWRSEDAGRHWQALWKRSTRDVSATPFLNLDGAAPNFGHWIAGLAIDPFDDTHAAYVTGATVYATQQFDTGGTMRWTPWTAGIEQTAIITMASPTGGAALISGFGDIAGFRHTDLAKSPAHLHLHPFLVNTNTLDYAGLAPDIMVRSGSAHSRVVPGPTLAWSSDNGENWQPLDPPHVVSADNAPLPVETGDAPIVVSANGKTFVVGGASPVLTRDRGKTWHPVRGLPPRVRITADKADAHRFYAIDFATNRVLRSDDGGEQFHPVAGRGLPPDLSGARVTWREAQNPMRATPGAAGALWLRIGDALYRSLNAGDTWQRTAQGLSLAYYGLGKAAPGSRWPALYAIGTRDGLEAVWRSVDGGDKWRRINDAAHQWGLRFRCIVGDPKQFGRVYIGTDGRGIVYGDPAAALASH